MSLKAVLSSLDGLDDSVKSLYEEKDGKYYLNLEGIEDHPSTSALKNALDGERSKRREATSAKEELAKKFEGLDPEKAKEALAKIEQLEEDELKSKGNIDELVESKVGKLKDTYQKELEAKDNKIAQLENDLVQSNTRLKEHIVFSQIRDVAAQKDILPTAIDDVINRARPLWRLGDNNEPVYVEDEDTGPRIGKNGNYTIDEWFTDLQDAAPHMFKGNEGTGAKSPRGGANSDGVKYIPPEDVGNYIEEIAEGTVQIRD